MNSKQRIIVSLIGVFIFGLILRVQAVMLTEINNPVRADAKKYVLYAYNLKNFGVYTHSDLGVMGSPDKLKSDALVTPGYPLFLSFFVGNNFSEKHYHIILLTQALLSALTVLFSYIIFAELNRVLGLVVSFFVACSPHLISLSTYLLTETLFCFFLTGFLALCSRLKNDSQRWLFFTTGILLGLTTLTRPWTQAFTVILLCLVVATFNYKRLLKPFWILTGFMCVVTPWIIRNYIAVGMPTDTTLSFVSVHHGMYPDMMYNFMPESLGFPYRYDPWAQNTSLSSQVVLEELLKRAKNNPWIYFNWYLWGKVKTVFSWDILAGMGDVFIYPVIKTPYSDLLHFRISHLFIKTIHSVCVIFAIMATIMAWLPSARRIFFDRFLFTYRVLSLLMIYFIILHMIGAPFPRYSIPMRPIIYGMAVVMLVWFHAFFKSIRHQWAMR